MKLLSTNSYPANKKKKKKIEQTSEVIKKYKC